MTTLPSESHRLLFLKKNRVSPGASVPALTKVRSGRWLHVQHLLPARPPRESGTDGDGNGTDERLGQSEKGNGAGQKQIGADAAIVKSRDQGGDGSRGDAVKTAPPSATAWTDDSQARERTDSIESIVALGSGMPPRAPLEGVSVFDRDGGTVLFFFHGVGGCSSLWYYQMRYFRERGFEVVAPDLFGHGFSDAPRREAAYSFYELAEDCLAVFDRYRKKRNMLIGHSYGSSFCTIIARERERKVTKMILLSGGGPVSLDPQTCHVFCLPAYVLACLKPLLTSAFRRQAFRERLPRVPSGDFNAFNAPSYVLRGTMRGQRWPEGNQDYHAEVNVAVLLVYGLQDGFVSLEETEWMHETIFASTLETVDAGHMVMLECPDQVNRLIHRFLVKNMTVRPPEGPSAARGREGVASPAPARRKTMPHLMPGGLSLS